MKGNKLIKKRLSFNIALATILISVVGVCLGMLFQPVKKFAAVNAANHEIAVLDNNLYSAMFSGDVIFSAEKVLVSNSYSGYMKNQDGEFVDNTLYPDDLASANTTFSSGAVYYTDKDETYAQPVTYSFSDIYDEKNSARKTVIKDGEFVKLDNYYQDVTGKYYDENSVDADRQQAVLLSFGAYVYYPETESEDGLSTIPEYVLRNTEVYDDKGTEETADDVLAHAGITYLEIVMQHNGEAVATPKIREISIDEGLYFDFSTLILQSDDNEGYYELSFRYMVKGREYTEKFSFYIINNLSYTRQIGNSARGYFAKPTLGWSDGTLNFQRTQLVNEYVQFNIGYDGLGLTDVYKNYAFPSITYDYTRYQLHYTLSANKKTTTYSYQVVFNTQKTEATLVCTISSSAGEEKVEYKLLDYSKENSTNLVSIILTESGYYVADYEFLYDGYASSSAPTPDFATETIKLEVNGFNMYYSKAGVDSAKLQYFEIARNVNNQVDIVLPNAFELGAINNFTYDETVGFAYKMVDYSSGEEAYDVYREGNVVYDNSVNSEVLKGENKGVYNHLIQDSGVLTEVANISADQASSITDALNNVNYVETNQGAMSIKGADGYWGDGKSFYYYSPTKITFESLYDGTTRKTGANDIKYNIDNTTTFNKKGYYLVFIKVNANTIDDGQPSSEYVDNYQMFAFRYTSISINMATSSGDALNKGNYTNENVTIKWKTPGLFDSAIRPYYYAVKNQNLSLEEVVKTTKNPLAVTTDENDSEYTIATLGSDVKNGEFVRYVVRLENEGKSATEKMFTVDRQPISGIAPYVVQAQYSINSSIYYSFAPNALGERIRIANSITNGYASFLWDDKASGAEIKVKYSYTPFVFDAKEQAHLMTGTKGEEWITTNYKLGTTIAGQDLYKSASSYNVTEDCILDDQGIYLLTFTDDAGNTCNYAFIIDRTENWLIVDDENPIHNGSYLSASEVKYTIGNRKVFDLQLSNLGETSEAIEVKNFIRNAAQNRVGTLENYYLGTYSNATNVAKFFEQLSDNYYFTVANTGVTAYDNINVIDKTITSISGTIKENVSNKNEFRRKLVVNSENATYSQTQNITSVVESYAIIVINTDNALGSVFFSSSPADSGIEDALEKMDSNGTYTKMDLGGGEAANPESGSPATSAKHLAFAWKKGTGVFEVEKVELDFYELRVGGAEVVTDNAGVKHDPLLRNYQFSQNTVIYSGVNSNVLTVGTEWLVYKFNGELTSKEGLYVVRRTYKDDNSSLPESEQDKIYGKDRRVREYYFIVDRNGIISIEKDDDGNIIYENSIGAEIKLLLQENLVEFREFTTINAETGTLIFTENEKTVTKKYSIYLKTNRLPAVINVPLEKYFTIDTYKDEEFNYAQAYHAGNLNVQIFYADTANQFEGSDKAGKIVEIFNSRKLLTNGELQNYIDEDGSYKLDFKKYLQYAGYDINFINKLCSSTAGNWIYLPGDYIVRITDNSTDENGASHERLIALKIDSNGDVGPQAEIKYGHDEENLWTLSKNASTNVTVTTSQKYLELLLTPPDNTNANKAQLDQSYLKIEQVLNGSSPTIYQRCGGYINLSESSRPSNVIANNDGSFSVKLDTMLNENNLQQSLNIDLRYIITLRYILGNEYGSERFEECYYYYDGNGTKIKFYETKYTIIVDRVAPSENINNLNNADNLVKDYCAEQGVEKMFEREMYDSGEQLYFTYQYAKYYQAKKEYDSSSKKYLYVFHVDETTKFSSNDISKVYVRELDDIENTTLGLPLYSTNGYCLNDLEIENREISSYADLYYDKNMLLLPGVYYEVVEQDAAGNSTQYIIAYSMGVPTYQIPVSIVPINADEMDVTITENVSSLDVFSITASNGNKSVFEAEKFFKIRLTKNDALVKTWLTNLSTDFDNLGAEIVEVLNENAKNGENSTFRLSLASRKFSATTTISVFKNTDVALYASDLVVNNNLIILNRANKNSVYAKEIRIYCNGVLTIYNSKWEGGELSYYVGDSVQDNRITCNIGVTYSITVVSVLGTTSTYRFVAGQADNVWHSVEFNGGHGYSQGDAYYGFDDATLWYDFYIYNKVVINGNLVVHGENSGTGVEVPLPASDYSIMEYTILLTACDTQEVTSVRVVIDKKMGSVVLNNSTVGMLDEGYLGQEDNVEFEEEIPIQKIATGALTLSWNEVENSYFDYVYVLYGLDATKEVKSKIIFNSQLNYGLVPNAEYSAYRFEIRVYQKDKVDLEALVNGATSLDQLEDWYIGNRVFAFEVKLTSNIFYEVRYVTPEENEVATLKANSTFNLSEVIASTMLSSDSEFAIRSRFSEVSDDDFKTLKDVNYDLYLSYRELYLVTIDAESIVKVALKLSEDKTYFEFINPTSETYSQSELDQASLIIYEIVKSGVPNLYVGILEIESTPSLISNVKLINGTTATYDVQDITSFTIYGDATIRAEVKKSSNVLLKKNTLSMDVLFIDAKFKSINVVPDSNGKFEHYIEGNGEYSFIFKDLAGNVHLFDGERFGKLTVNVVREVNVMINGEAPVAHAIYNEAVELVVYKSQIYKPGSVIVEAYRNGSPYTPQGSNPRYIFNNFGNYRVIVRAEYAVGNDVENLSKTLYFSILNINEARTSVDLTSMSGNALIKVLNQDGKDITNAFKAMMNSSEYGGANISYESVMANAETLDVTSGKISFIVTYEVEDINYPTRIVEFGFTLNNETPKIQCTLKTGESTKKSFEIYFNPQIIFEQVGDAGVYINGELVASINENSTNDEVRISRSYKANGKGDYYVTLVSSSGLVLDSYKVVIKEPLNAGAIILIIVITAVVATVVIVIIVLRRKMRIR